MSEAFNPGDGVLTELEPHQKVLLSELNSRDPFLADIYFGSLRVLSDNANPDRYHLAAHGFRELLDRLPDHLGISSKELKISMSSKVFSLRDIWEKFVGQLDQEEIPNMWGTTINPALRKFLNAAYGFFLWLEEHRPRRRAEIGQTIDEFEYSQVGLPDAIMSLRIDEWIRYSDYFVGVAHHGLVDSEVFKTFQYSFETYLLDRFSPRTFDEIQRIDELIKRGESSD